MKLTCTCAFLALLCHLSIENSAQAHSGDAEERREVRVITDLSELMNHPMLYSNKWVLTRGFTFAEQGLAYLFVRSTDVSPNNLKSSLDLVAIPEKTGVLRSLKTGACADVYGKFRAYSDELIPSGNLLSQVGILEVKRISSCPPGAA